MDIRRAEFIRVVDRGELLEALIDEAKGETWEQAREHALVEASDGRLLLICGGYDGIQLAIQSEQVGMFIDAVFVGIRTLAWHIHPRPTGPSSHDFEVLRRLRQESSMIYEINGDEQGTFYRVEVSDDRTRQ